MSNTENEGHGGDTLQTDNIERGPEEPKFTVLVVNDDDVIQGASGWHSAEAAGRAVMVLADTYALDDELHIEVRQ